ncbi:hypothetical protein ACFWY6_03565 [Streptomyces sp. NPDC059037]
MTARTPGPVVRAMVQYGKGGDFRNPQRVQEWVHHIGAELTATH